MSGFIAFRREALDHPALRNANHFGAWVWLACHARWTPSEQGIGGGQVCLTYDQFADCMGWNVFSAKRCLRHFERCGMISIASDKRRMVVTLLDRSTFSLEDSLLDGTGWPRSEVGIVGRSQPVFGREREPLTPAIRNAVIERDGRICRYCGSEEAPFEIDHIVAVASGGSNDLTNLCVACQPCNRSKGAKDLAEWEGGR